MAANQQNAQNQLLYISPKGNIYHFSENLHNLKREIDLIEKCTPGPKFKKYKKNQYRPHRQSQNPVLQLAHQSTGLANFLESLFKLDFFKKFATIHFFLHEKGHGNAEQYTITKNMHNTYCIPAHEYNALALSIKKSKNQSFGQSALKGESYNIQGTFLAQENQYDSYSTIFILSKNEFLPQDQADISQFNDLKSLIRKSLFEVATIHLNQNKSMLYTKILSVTPCRIYDHDDEIQPQDNIDISLVGKKVITWPTTFFNNKLDLAIHHHKEKMLLLGDLLNTLHHELSNPLFGLKLSSELLLQDAQTQEQKQFIQEIIKAQARSQKILNSFANYFTRDEKSIISLDELVAEVFTLTKSETKGVYKYIKHRNKESKDLSLFTHSMWPLQILFNLIINSTQAFNENDQIKNEICVLIDKSEENLTISIIDNGPGITNKEQTEKLFRPFFTTKKQGTGLGLSLSQNLAKKMDSLIILDQSYNKGAKFDLICPLSILGDNNENTNN